MAGVTSGYGMGAVSPLLVSMAAVLPVLALWLAGGVDVSSHLCADAISVVQRRRGHDSSIDYPDPLNSERSGTLVESCLGQTYSDLEV